MNKTVLHIAPTPFFADRGCHIRIEGIVSCLSELGYSNLVCTYHHGRDIPNVRTSRISTIKNYTSTHAGPSKYKLWADWKLLCLVVKEIRRSNPVAIHAHLHEGLMIALIAKILLFRRSLPLVADMQGSLVGELESHGSFKGKPWLKWPVKAIEASLMFFAKTIVCSSEHALEIIKAEFNVDGDKISLVQDGARAPSILTHQARGDLRRDLSLPAQKSLVVYSGALLQSKGLNELKQLIALSANKQNVHFLIIGYPVDELQSYLNDSELRQNCTLTGQVDFEKLPALLQLADVAIDPKFSDAGEGSGKLLNYLACGLPVVAFNSNNNRSFLPQGSQLANSVDEMSDQLVAMLADQEALKQIGETNFAHFDANYSWSKTKSQLASIYQSLFTTVF